VQIAEEIRKTSQYVNRVIKKKDGVVNNTVLQMMGSSVTILRLLKREK